MKGLKNKMSIKAFCKRGLAIMLACAMVAPGVGSVIHTQAAVISSGDEWITTSNDLEVKLSVQMNGEDGEAVIAAGPDHTVTAGSTSVIFDNNTSTSVTFRKQLSGWGGVTQVGDYIQVEFKEAIDLKNATFYCPPGKDFFASSTIAYTTDGKTWKDVQIGAIPDSNGAVVYSPKAVNKDVKAIRLINEEYNGNTFMNLAEIIVETEDCVSPVAEKYEPKFAESGVASVEDGVYAILGARNDGNSSVNKAVNSTKTLTYTDVAEKVVGDFLMNPEDAYLWEITNVEGGYNVSAVDGDGYLTIITNDAVNGATVADEVQLISITKNGSYENSVNIGNDAIRGYLNHRDSYPGTWWDRDLGCAYYLYKFGYKISDMFVYEAISSVEDKELYTSDSWNNYETAKTAIVNIYETETAAKTAYDNLVNAVAALEKLSDETRIIDNVCKKYVPTFDENGVATVENGIYAILGARSDGEGSLNKAINSTKTLTYTYVADKIVNGVLMHPEKDYLWEITNVEGGYNLNAIDGDGYLTILRADAQKGATVSDGAQLINIKKNTNCDDTVTIGNSAVGGNLNHRNPYPGTWTGADIGSAYYLYKFGYKISEKFVSDAIVDVIEDESAYVNGWEDYINAKKAVEEIYATATEAKATYDALVEVVENLEKKETVTGVTLDQNKVTIDEIGATVTLTATVNPESAVNKNLVWATDNDAVATVDGGVITAVGNGVATITVTTVDGGFTATCEVVVEKIEDKIELYVGENITKEISHGGEVEVENSSVATAEVMTTEIKNVVLYNKGAAEVNEDISMENAAWKFTQVEGGWNIYNESTGIYFVNTRNVGFGSKTADIVTVDVVENQDGDMEAVQIWRPEGQNKRYVIYWGNSARYDAVSVADTSVNNDGSWVYNLKLLEYTGTGEFGGWTVATEMKSGKEYVIAHVTDSDVFVLYPQEAQDEQATKKAGILTTEKYSLVVNAHMAGNTNVWVGNKIYEVEVAEFVVVATAGSVRDNGQLGPDGKAEKDPCRILDGNRENNWLSDPDDAIEDSWVNFELPKAKIVDGLKLYYGSGDYVHKGYEVLVSVDGANWTKVCEGTFENTPGEKTIKFKPVEAKNVRLVPTAKYNKEFAIWEAEILYADAIEKEWFVGGSLRMDYADDYDKTCLRFMYAFPETMAGLEAKTWFWNYGLNDNVSNTRVVEAGKWGVKDGLINSNIVFTNVGRENYDTPVYTKLTITYSDASDANTLTVYDTVVAERSVNDVAGAIENAYKDSVDEREVKQYNYALGILGKTTSAQ